MLMTMIMLFNMISGTFGSTLNVTILIILIINIFVKNDPWCYITFSNSIFSSNCLNNKKFGSLLISQDGQTNNFIFDSLIYHTSTSWFKYSQDVWVRIYFYLSYVSSKSNIIIESIYRHRSMDHDDFNQSFLNKFLEKVSKEQKSVFFWSEFNVNLLNYNGHTPTNEYLDFLASNSVIPYILQPYRQYFLKRNYCWCNFR